MSGPKISRVDIEAQRKAQLEKERRERLERLIKAQRDYDSAVVEATKVIDEIWDYYTVYEVSGREGWSFEEHTALYDELIKLSNELRGVERPSTTSIEEWVKKTASQRENTQRIKAIAIDKINKVKDREKNRQQLIDNDLLSKKADIDIDPEKKVVFQSGKLKKRLKEMLDTIISDSIELEIGSKVVLNQLNKTKKRAAELHEQLEGCEPKEIDVNFENEIQNTFDEYIICMEKWERQKAFYQRYIALCNILGKKQKEYQDFTDIKELVTEIELYEKEYSERDEMEFIASSINEAMHELGYSCVESHLLYAQEGEQDFSVYREPGDSSSGIVVYTGMNGEVMMRVATLTVNDTSEEVAIQEDLTEEEKNVSLMQQISFCNQHPDIIRAVRRKGVILRQKSYLPPERNSAMKVIVNKNVSKGESRSIRDYERSKKMSKM